VPELQQDWDSAPTRVGVYGVSAAHEEECVNGRLSLTRALSERATLGWEESEVLPILRDGLCWIIERVDISSHYPKSKLMIILQEDGAIVDLSELPSLKVEVCKANVELSTRIVDKSSFARYEAIDLRLTGKRGRLR